MTNKQRRVVIFDNAGTGVEVWGGCKLGDKFRCIKGKKGLDDAADFSFVFEVDQTITDKIYKVDSIGNWDGIMIPRITDDNGCSSWLQTNYFEPVATDRGKN